MCVSVCVSLCSGEARVYSLENKNEGRCLFGNGMNFYCIFSESPQAVKPLGTKISSPGFTESTCSLNLPTSVICLNSSSSLHLRHHRLAYVTLKNKRRSKVPSSLCRFAGVAAGQRAWPQWAGLPQEADERGAVLTTADRGTGPSV